MLVDMFRMKIILKPLLRKGKVDANFITKVVNQSFDAQEGVGNGVRWRMGQPKSDGDALKFNFGKSSVHQGGMYDEQKKDFVKTEQTDAPYTPVYIDTAYGVVGIVHNSKLTSSTGRLAGKIADFFRNNCGENSVADVTISPITDPVTLVAAVDTAYAVTKAEFESTPPNPWDSEGFPKDFADYVGRTKAKKGKVLFSGEDLDRGIIKQILHAMSSLGQNANVSVRMREGEKTVKKILDGIVRVVPKKGAPIVDVCSQLRKKYHEIKRLSHEKGENDEK